MLNVECACTDCASHDMCRLEQEPGEDMCLWCGIEAVVERRWAEMLKAEAEGRTDV